MLRKVLAAAGAVLAATILPVTAASADTEDFAYTADEYSMTLSVTTATVGVPFTVSLSGPDGNSSFTLEVPDIDDSAIEVAGAQTASAAGGSADFSVTLPEAGTYDLTAMDAEGQVVASASVTAVEAGAGTTAGADTGSGGFLAMTGSDALPYLMGAGVLVIAGIALLAARSRTRGRTEASTPSKL